MRNRNWILAAVLVVAVILAALLAGRHGANGGAGRPRVSFGPGVEQLRGSGDLIYTNGWMAGSGTRSIGVYAGSQRRDRTNGLFLIARRSPGGQTVSRVLVRGSGALTLLRPAPPATEDAAFHETLHFVTASGSTGTLNLAGDRVTTSG